MRDDRFFWLNAAKLSAFCGYCLQLKLQIISVLLSALDSNEAKSKQATKQILSIRDEKARMKVTLPLAVARLAQEDDMRWNPNDV